MVINPETIILTSEEIKLLENRLFELGMPVPALMEKAGLLLTNTFTTLYPLIDYPKVNVLVGLGHNGGDALVMARELFLKGYSVNIYAPFPQLKELTQAHANYADHLGIPFYHSWEAMPNCDVFIDGFFGFGLTRNIPEFLVPIIEQINHSFLPVFSIDIPSGLHTDTGEVLGTAIKAHYSACLGVWKRAYFQDQAISYIGKNQRLDLGFSAQDIQAIVGDKHQVIQVTGSFIKSYLPLPRSPLTHKYKQGNLLLVAGSEKYAGSVILAGLGARASGVGMLSIATPKCLKSTVVSQLPEALVIGCPETENGVMEALDFDLSPYNIVVAGAGLTLSAKSVIATLINSNIPLVLDADALNIIAENNWLETLKKRQSITVLTPHLGEFKRLFPHLKNPEKDRIVAVETASAESGCVILLKGAKTIIVDRLLSQKTYILSKSTPALARGGSGDVLLGFLGGLLSQQHSVENTLETTALAGWCHAQAGILASHDYTEMGVDPVRLSQYLLKR